MIYPNDEPYALARLNGHSAAAVKQDLEKVGALIKKTFPNIPLGFTFSRIDYDVRDGAFALLENPLPEQFDWFGLACYGSWSFCGDASTGNARPITE